MLIERSSRSGIAQSSPLLLRGEAFHFETLRNNLPCGWVIELAADAGMAWIAFVYYADAPRSTPMFTVCRWTDRVGLFVQWMDGSASSAIAFTDLEPIMDLIPNGIFASAEARLATVSADCWTDARH